MNTLKSKEPLKNQKKNLERKSVDRVSNKYFKGPDDPQLVILKINQPNSSFE